MAFFESVKCPTQSPRAQIEVRLLKNPPKDSVCDDKRQRKAATCI